MPRKIEIKILEMSKNHHDLKSTANGKDNSYLLSHMKPGPLHFLIWTASTKHSGCCEQQTWYYGYKKWLL